jgi:hypothetical protein
MSRIPRRLSLTPTTSDESDESRIDVLIPRVAIGVAAAWFLVVALYAWNFGRSGLSSSNEHWVNLETM